MLRQTCQVWPRDFQGKGAQGNEENQEWSGDVSPAVLWDPAQWNVLEIKQHGRIFLIKLGMQGWMEFWEGPMEFLTAALTPSSGSLVKAPQMIIKKCRA